MPKSRELDPLDKVGWLAQQSLHFRQWAEQVGRWKKFEKGQFVYHYGDPADGMYGLASGSLHITFPLVAEEPVIIHRAEIGFWIGDAAVLAQEPRQITVMAASPTRLLHLSSSSIKILLANSPEHWHAFYKLSLANSRLAVTLLAEALSLTVRARVCRRLLEMIDGSGSAAITQDDLSKLLGVARPTLRRALVDLEADGAIELHYRNIVVLDPALLKRFQNEQ